MMPEAGAPIAAIAVALIASGFTDLALLLLPSHLRYWLVGLMMKLVAFALMACCPTGFVLSTSAVLAMRGWDADNTVLKASPIVFIACGFIGYALYRSSEKVQSWQIPS